MSDTIETPEDPSETLESEPIEQSETLISEPIEQPEIFEQPGRVVDVDGLETVELPTDFPRELPTDRSRELPTDRPQELPTDRPREYRENVDKFGPSPIDMICPECGVTMTTRTFSEITSFGNVDSSSCLFACLNICFGGIELIRHRCPECDALLGTYSSPYENTDNYRSRSPDRFMRNGGEHVITQDVGSPVKCEPAAANDENDCLEVEDFEDDVAENVALDDHHSGDEDCGDGGGDADD